MKVNLILECWVMSIYILTCVESESEFDIGMLGTVHLYTYSCLVRK